jgi:hypothetical protein
MDAPYFSELAAVSVRRLAWTMGANMGQAVVVRHFTVKNPPPYRLFRKFQIFRQPFNSQISFHASIPQSVVTHSRQLKPHIQLKNKVE